MVIRPGKSGICAAVVVAAAALLPLRAAAQAPAGLPLEQVLDGMALHDRTQAAELKHYEAVRHYQVAYKGFSTSVVAQMDVDVKFEAATGKSFHIRSESGSKVLCDRVLKKAIESEADASHDREATAMTSANYKFQLLGSESLNGRPSYILNVEPLKASKFLFKGKIWVDAEDFAVAKIEASPAKNPSFWISRTLIDSTNAKTGNFWLPKQNRSETKVRLGGRAVLTIDYGAYVIEPKLQMRDAGNESP